MFQVLYKDIEKVSNSLTARGKSQGVAKTQVVDRSSATPTRWRATPPGFLPSFEPQPPLSSGHQLNTVFVL